MCSTRCSRAGARSRGDVVRCDRQRPRARARLERVAGAHRRAIRRLSSAAFDKDLKRRLRDIGDARLEIDEALARPGAAVTAPVRRRSYVPLILTALAAAAFALVAAALWWRLHQSPAPVGGGRRPGDGISCLVSQQRDARRRPARSPRTAGRSSANVWINSGSLCIAPLDGSPTKTVDSAAKAAPRHSGSRTARRLDSSAASSATRRKLVTISANGGPVTRVASLPPAQAAVEARSAKARHRLLLSGKIFRVQATGGDRSRADAVGRSQGSRALSGVFCRTASTSSSAPDAVRPADRSDIASLDDREGAQAGRMRTAQAASRRVTTVLFLRRRRARSRASSICRGSRSSATAASSRRGVTRGALGPWPQLTPSASTTGVLAIPALRGGSPLGQLTWFDRNGKITGAIAQPAEPDAEYSNPVISPTNEKLVAANRTGPADRRLARVGDRRRARQRRLQADDRSLVGLRSRRGLVTARRSLYASDRGGEWAFYRQPYAGGAACAAAGGPDRGRPTHAERLGVGDRLLFSQLQRSIWTVLLGDRLPTALGASALSEPYWAASVSRRPLAGVRCGARPVGNSKCSSSDFRPARHGGRSTTRAAAAHPRWTRTAKGTELVYWSVTEGIESVPLSLQRSGHSDWRGAGAGPAGAGA